MAVLIVTLLSRIWFASQINSVCQSVLLRAYVACCCSARQRCRRRGRTRPAAAAGRIKNEFLVQTDPSQPQSHRNPKAPKPKKTKREKKRKKRY